LAELAKTDGVAAWLKGSVVALADGTEYKTKPARLDGGLTLVTFDLVK
jgi:hypothetical protein